MSDKKFSRRDFLRLSALTAAGAILASCGPRAPEPAAPTSIPAEPTDKPAEPVATAQASAGEVVTLEIQASNPEYNNAERQMWDIFEEKYPNIKVELFDVNEDTMAAFQAKVAGGYTPAFAQGWAFATAINKDNYANFLDMSTITEIPWDKFTNDPVGTANKKYGWGLRGFAPFKGFTFTWVYHADLMEAAGLDPRESVKTFDDLKAWLQAGTDWVKTRDDLDFFWDMGWETWSGFSCWPVILGMAFPDGQIANNVAMWKGEIAVNSPETPIRHYLEFYKEAYDKGWLPQNFWTREWEADMEASFAAKRTVVNLHGPWVWDKAVAANPNLQLAGIPASPPAEGQQAWMQWRWPAGYVGGETTVLARAVEQPWWPQAKQAIIWWNSAEALKMRAELYGVDTYMEGLTVDLDTPQWKGCVKEIGVPGGQWEDVQWTDAEPGEMVMDPERIPGSPGVFDQYSTAIAEWLPAFLKGEKSQQEFLDWCQSNWDKSFEL
jgi:ABC-type glycerol-3-phosphate transport system substrate-binding protein